MKKLFILLSSITLVTLIATTQVNGKQKTYADAANSSSYEQSNYPIHPPVG